MPWSPRSNPGMPKVCKFNLRLEAQRLFCFKAEAPRPLCSAPACSCRAKPTARLSISPFVKNFCAKSLDTGWLQVIHDPCRVHDMSWHGLVLACLLSLEGLHERQEGVFGIGNPEKLQIKGRQFGIHDGSVRIDQPLDLNGCRSLDARIRYVQNLQTGSRYVSRFF